MRHFAIAILASLATSLVGMSRLAAQTNPPAPASSATPPAAAAPASQTPAGQTPAGQTPAGQTPSALAPGMTKDGKPKAKDVRAECRVTAKGEGLKGDAMRKAVSDCFVKERPDLAGKEQCRMDGFAKGLRKDELKAFVKDCAKSKG